MSSSYIIESLEDCSKKDDTLILMVNDNGVISVDQETLQNLIINQSNANVSVVRLGQTGNDAVEGNITLTVDPPNSFAVSTPSISSTPADQTVLVDPFMEMDPEQLERLETALQSEEAKQILGENVTAMLDMLTVEEQQNSIKHSIELDHCYTSRFSSLQPKPVDHLPDVSSPDMEESVCLDISDSLAAHTQALTLPISVSSGDGAATTSLKQNVIAIPPKIVKPPALLGSRPKRSSTVGQLPTTTITKPAGSTLAQTNLTLLDCNKSIVDHDKNKKELEEAENSEQFSSSETSISNDSDSDSDFGPKSSRRGIRARGCRRGLTTRGGSMAVPRRRGSNKTMDIDQVRRLDVEMAAAVSAMKSPEKDENLDKNSPKLNKKPVKILSVKRNDDALLPSTALKDEPTAPTTVFEQNVLQTTNQVKANLINANMIKGDMILTKPGQDRVQKVVFIQKKVAVDQGDMKDLAMKKQVMIPKNKLITSQNSKVPTSNDVKVSTISPPVIRKLTPSYVENSTVIPVTQCSTVTSINVQTSSLQQIDHQQKIVSPVFVKSSQKLAEIKKEKKKSDALSDISCKSSVEANKTTETKTVTAPKKAIKKEHRKSDTLVAETLGPALFSTPDIIRRVSSTYEPKVFEGFAVTTVNNTSAPIITTPISSISSVKDTLPPIITTNVIDESINTNLSLNTLGNNASNTAHNSESSILSNILEDDKIDNKVAMTNLRQQSLDSESHTSLKEMHPTGKQSSVTKNVSENSIECDEHLLTTLEIEAAKQLPNDEEFLAEALLLQESLDVDLEHSELVDPSSEISECVLSSSVIESGPSIVTPTISSQPLSTASISLSTTPLDTSAAPMKSEAKKDSKEPIQIVRGGRVITLPPIEAPATRSKRLQAKTDNQQTQVEKKSSLKQPHQSPKVEPFIIKNDRISRSSSHVSVKNQDMVYDMDDDDEEDVNSESEDDPNRLWCICRQPHNNRFMICCDMCQDWFHGKCVHVTKAMGEQMENHGIEWVCPNCSKKKNDETKSKLSSKKSRNSTNISHEQSRILVPNISIAPPLSTESKVSLIAGQNTSIASSVTSCVVCKKEARKSSIYCSDACILAHAEETSTKDKPSINSQTKIHKIDNKQLSQKFKTNIRIIVYDKKTGKVLTGADAPTTSNLKSWLIEHPNYEIVKSNNLNTVQLGGKTVAAIQTQGIKTNKQSQGKSPMPAKMIHAKVSESKQTATPPNTKKTTLLFNTPSVRTAASPQQRVKQSTVAMTSIKTLKQAPKLTLTHDKVKQEITQKPLTISTPRAAFIKNPLESKSLISQQKLQLGQSQEQQSPLLHESPQLPKTATKNQIAKKSETEPIRVNVRKTLSNLLNSRIQAAKDLSLTEEEITDLALKIELEMYKFFKDTGSKYKAKYRSLLFNIKDTKNLTLFRKIADRSLTPDAVVKLSPEEMASQELAEWREKETKHQLEMIKKNELDLMAQAKSIVVKTHKGEQIIENDGGIETVDSQDIVTVLKSSSTDLTANPALEEEKDPSSSLLLLTPTCESKFLDDMKKNHGRQRSRSRNRSSKEIASSGKHSRSRSRHRHKDRVRSHDKKSKKDSKHKDKNRSRDKDRDKSRVRDRKKDKNKSRKDKHKSVHSSSRSHGNNNSSSIVLDSDKSANCKEFKKKPKKEHLEQQQHQSKNDDSISSASNKSIDERLWKHIEDEVTSNPLDGNESDISDREPSSTVIIKTPDINEELDKEFETRPNETTPAIKFSDTPIWRGCVNMSEVAKFYVTAFPVSGHAKELMEGLPDYFDVVGRISPLTVWEYIAQMRNNVDKEIVLVKLTAINDEEKIPYITLYSYLNSRNRLGVLRKGISPKLKDFYILPFSSTSKLPQILLPLEGPGLEKIREPLLLGIAVHNRGKRSMINSANTSFIETGPSPAKIQKKESQLDVDSVTDYRSHTSPPSQSQGILATHHLAAIKEEPITTQNFSVLSKIVPELSCKIELESTSPSDRMQFSDKKDSDRDENYYDVCKKKIKDEDNNDDNDNLNNDDDEPYSPGEPVLDDSGDKSIVLSSSNVKALDMPRTKSSSELQRKMEEITRQIEEEKQQIQSISSSFLSDTTTNFPGLSLETSGNNEMLETYSSTSVRSFTPPPQSISKLTQPILEKVSNITIPPNLQEILANVKRQESSKLDSYIPSKPCATFLTTVSSTLYQNSEKYSSIQCKTSSTLSDSVVIPIQKDTKSTLSSLSDYDLMKKAEEELAAMAATNDTIAIASTTPLLKANKLLSSSVPDTSHNPPHR